MCFLLVPVFSHSFIKHCLLSQSWGQTALSGTPLDACIEIRAKSLNSDELSQRAAETEKGNSRGQVPQTHLHLGGQQRWEVGISHRRAAGTVQPCEAQRERESFEKEEVDFEMSALRDRGGDPHPSLGYARLWGSLRASSRMQQMPGSEGFRVGDDEGQASLFRNLAFREKKK